MRGLRDESYVVRGIPSAEVNALLFSKRDEVQPGFDAGFLGGPIGGEDERRGCEFAIFPICRIADDGEIGELVALLSFSHEGSTGRVSGPVERDVARVLLIKLVKRVGVGRL